MQFSLPGFRTFLILTRLAPRAPTLFKERVVWGKRYAKDSHYSTISPAGSTDRSRDSNVGKVAVRAVGTWPLDSRMPGIPQREMGRRGVRPAPVRCSVLELK